MVSILKLTRTFLQVKILDNTLLCWYPKFHNQVYLFVDLKNLCDLKLHRRTKRYKEWDNFVNNNCMRTSNYHPMSNPVVSPVKILCMLLLLINDSTLFCTALVIIYSCHFFLEKSIKMRCYQIVNVKLTL